MADYNWLVQQGYDAIAQAYLKHRSIDSADRSLLHELSEILPKYARVLDVGCGAGVPVTKLLSLHFDVVGVDFSGEQIRLARKLVPTATFIFEDVMALELPAESFNAVISYYAVFHIPREMHAALFKRFYYWLTPGGYTLLCLGYKEQPDVVEGSFLGVPMFFSSFDREKNLELLVNAGFDIKWEQFIPELPRQNPEHGYLFVLAQKPPQEAG